jgi:hypothetical protein
MAFLSICTIARLTQDSGFGFRWSGGSVSSAPSHSLALCLADCGGQRSKTPADCGRRRSDDVRIRRTRAYPGSEPSDGWRANEIVARPHTKLFCAQPDVCPIHLRAPKVAVVGDGFRFHFREIGRASRFSTRMGPAVFVF